VNDPASAASATAAIDDLFRIIADRDLDVGWISDADGRLRVVLQMPTWEDFLHVGVDDVAHYVTGVPIAGPRLRRLLDDLAELVPPQRREAVDARRKPLAGV
jgi:uncharacterized membrane protein